MARCRKLPRTSCADKVVICAYNAYIKSSPPIDGDFAAMSFGGPGGGQKNAKPIPPERGSFPLEYVVRSFAKGFR